MSDSKENRKRWLKAEMHTHCNQDPEDHKLCRHSAEELIREAARTAYDVLAITCHDEDIWSRDLSAFAESLGITLIPGMEVAVEGRYHVLVYNFRTGSENLNTFDKIRERSREDTLVVAPHAFFPGLTCLRSRLEKNIDLFDAVEVSGFHIKGMDFNRRARAVACKYAKPLVGSGDIHMLWQLDRTFTRINSEPGILPVLHAIKRGSVQVESRRLSYRQALGWWGKALWSMISPASPPSRRRLAPWATEQADQ